MTHPNWFADDAETTGTIPAAPAVDRIDCDSCVCDPDRPGCAPTPAADPDPVGSPTVKLRAVATAVQSTLLPADGVLTADELRAVAAVAQSTFITVDGGPPLTAGPGPLPAELSNPALEPAAVDDPAPLSFLISELEPDEMLHAGWCACGDIDNPDPAEHQGVDFREFGAAYEAKVIERHLGRHLDDARARPAVADVPHVLPPRHAALAVAPVEAKVSAGAGGALAASLGVALGTALLQNLDVLPSLLGGDHPWAGALVTGLGVALPPLVGLWRGYQAPHSPRCEP